MPYFLPRKFARLRPVSKRQLERDRHRDTALPVFGRVRPPHHRVHFRS